MNHSLLLPNLSYARAPPETSLAERKYISQVLKQKLSLSLSRLESPPQARSSAGGESCEESAVENKSRLAAAGDGIHVLFPDRGKDGVDPPMGPGRIGSRQSAQYGLGDEEAPQTTMISASVREALARASSPQGEVPVARADGEEKARAALEFAPGLMRHAGKGAADLGRGVRAQRGISSQRKGTGKSGGPSRPHAAGKGAALSRGEKDENPGSSSRKGSGSDLDAITAGRVSVRLSHLEAMLQGTQKTEDAGKSSSSTSGWVSAWRRLDSGSWRRVEEGCSEPASSRGNGARDTLSDKSGPIGRGGRGGGDEPLSPQVLARDRIFDDSEDDSLTDENTPESSPYAAAAAAAAKTRGDGREETEERGFEPSNRFWSAVRSLVGGGAGGGGVGDGGEHPRGEDGQGRATDRSFSATGEGENSRRHSFGDGFGSDDDDDVESEESQEETAGDEMQDADDKDYAEDGTEDSRLEGSLRPLRAIGELFLSGRFAASRSENEASPREPSSLLGGEEGNRPAELGQQAGTPRSGTGRRWTDRERLEERTRVDSVRRRAESQKAWDLLGSSHDQLRGQERADGAAGRDYTGTPYEADGKPSLRPSGMGSNSPRFRPGAASPSGAGQHRFPPPSAASILSPSTTDDLPSLVDMGDDDRGLEGLVYVSSPGPVLGGPASSRSWSSASSTAPSLAYSPYEAKNRGLQQQQQRQSGGYPAQAPSPSNSEWDGSVASPHYSERADSPDPRPRRPPSPSGSLASRNYSGLADSPASRRGRPSSPCETIASQRFSELADSLASRSGRPPSPCDSLASSRFSEAGGSPGSGPARPPSPSGSLASQAYPELVDSPGLRPGRPPSPASGPSSCSSEDDVDARERSALDEMWER